MHSKLDIDASVVIDDKIACFPLTKRSELDVEAAREAIRSVLPAGGASADSPVLVYWKDSLTVRVWGTIHYSCLPAMPCHLPVAQQLRPPRFGLPAQVEQQLPQAKALQAGRCLAATAHRAILPLLRQGAGSYTAEGGEQMVEALQRSHAALKQVGAGAAQCAGWQGMLRLPHMLQQPVVQLQLLLTRLCASKRVGSL